MQLITRTCACVVSTLGVSILLAGCPSQPTQPSCLFGFPIVVAATDTSPPTVALEFYVGGGQALPVSAGTIVAPPGRVTVFARATDPEGPKDVQLWVETISCTVSNGHATCPSPGLSGRPVASSPNTATVGDRTCSQRVAQMTLDVVATPARTVSHRLKAVAINYSGQRTELGEWTLRAQ